MDRLRLHILRQDAHSLYLTFAASLMALTLVVDLLFHGDMEQRWLLWSLLAFCIAAGLAVFAVGSRVPRWIGIVSVLVFICAHAYYLGLATDPRSVVASVQQLPIIAFYLGWFVRPRFAIALILASVTVFGIVMLRNPLFAPDGRIGAPVALHSLLGLLFCFIAGSYLWRRQSRAALIDPLTGACNRRAIVDRLERLLQRRTAKSEPACLVLIDFDRFKQLNDSRGHAAGDTALVEAVAAWKESLRPDDVVGRIGGDEFALLLPRTDAATARGIVHRLRSLEAHPWSAGIAQTREGDSLASMFDRADRELYAEKHERGRGSHG